MSLPLKRLIVGAMIVGVAILSAIAIAGPEPAAAHPNARYVVTGDVDCDGDEDSVDALKVLRYIDGLSVTQSEPCPDLGTVVAYRDTSDNHRAYDFMGNVDLGGVPDNPAHCDGVADVDAADAEDILRYVARLPVPACKAPATTGGGNYVKIELGHNPYYYGGGTPLMFGWY